MSLCPVGVDLIGLPRNRDGDSYDSVQRFNPGRNLRMSVCVFEDSIVTEVKWRLLRDRKQARNHESEVTGDHMECGPQKPPGWYGVTKKLLGTGPQCPQWWLRA